jgi:glycerol-3-phosphate dehydrogenase (NAD(P)+)
VPRIAIIGATTWGATLGVVLAQKKHDVRLLARTEREAQEMKSNRLYNLALPPGGFPAKLSFTGSAVKALEKAKAVIMVVPAQTMRKNIKHIAPHLTDSMLLISASKGLETTTSKRMTEVIAEEIPLEMRRNICVLSGPNLAREILGQHPAATVLAAEDEEVRIAAQKLLNTPQLCVYTNTDVIGVELGGAFKNIIALAAGVADGLGYGDNAKAALMTRGWAEITALGQALGANPLTFGGLAGLGDLIATCASPLSRNHYVGIELTKGRKLEEITDSMDNVAEGVGTSLAAWKLSKKLGIGMPVTEMIYKVLYEGMEPRQAATELLQADTRHELEGRKWRLLTAMRKRIEKTNP